MSWLFLREKNLYNFNSDLNPTRPSQIVKFGVRETFLWKLSFGFETAKRIYLQSVIYILE